MRSRDGDIKALLSPKPPSPYKSPEDFIVGEDTDDLDADKKKKCQKQHPEQVNRGLFERKIAYFSQKYGLKMNYFMKRKRRGNSPPSLL